MYRTRPTRRAAASARSDDPRRAAPADRVFIRGLEFDGSHGVTTAERRGTRRFRVDIEICADLALPSQTDRLGDTVDYAAVSAAIVGVGTGKPFHLLEACAGAMIAAIKPLCGGRQVALTLEKLAAPCVGAPAACGVRLVR